MEAAFTLYDERGFDQTTVADIAERAGLTERTFFRHFADKREVFFAGAEELRALMVSAVASCPPETPPIDAVASALEAAGAFIQQGGEFPRRRQAIIAASEELRERELIKLAELARALAAELGRRGVGDAAAGLAAETGLAVFKVAFARWIASAESLDLPGHIREALAELSDALGAPGVRVLAVP